MTRLLFAIIIRRCLLLVTSSIGTPWTPWMDSCLVHIPLLDVEPGHELWMDHFLFARCLRSGLGRPKNRRHIFGEHHRMLVLWKIPLNTGNLRNPALCDYHSPMAPSHYLPGLVAFHLGSPCCLSLWLCCFLRLHYSLPFWSFCLALC